MTSPAPSSRSVSLRLTPDRSAPQAARRALAGLALRPEVRADVAIIVSELVTNSVVHGGEGDIAVAIRAGDVVRVEVRDAGTGFAPGPTRMPAGPQQGGRGLPLVDALAQRWGVTTGDGFTVWAEVAG